MLLSFGFVSNIPRTHHDAQRPPKDFLFPSLGFVREFWVCFQHSTDTPRCSTPTLRLFVSEFWVCLRISLQLDNKPRTRKKNSGVGVEHHRVCVGNVRNKPKTRKQKIVGWVLSIVECASNVQNKSKTRQQTQDPEQTVQTSIVSNRNNVSF